VYEKVVNYEYNLTLKKLTSDTCHTCRTQLTLAHVLNSMMQQQLKSFIYARDALKSEAMLARADEAIACLVFDLQKTLPTPQLPTNKVYYMRQLWTYNLDILDCKSGIGHTYMWYEATASHGSQEVAILSSEIYEVTPR